MSDWKKVGENLVRHVPSRTIYLRGRVAGKVVRISLETDNLKIAKIARDAKLYRLREAAKEVDIGGIRSMGAMIDAVESRVLQPHLKASTRKFYKDVLRLLRASLPNTKAADFTHEKASSWWAVFAKGKSAQRANQCLSLAKRVGDVVVESGQARENPFGKLKPLPLSRKQKDMPDALDVGRIIESIRSQKLRYSEETANFVAFLAYSGLRINEAREVLWGDIGEDWLTVTGGKLGTKNRQSRKVPISEPLRELLDGMRAKHDPAPSPRWPLFQIKSPRKGLENAARRLGILHIHPHLLRHHFATWAIESGVDIPTVAKWLGHRDGGVLAIRTYGHLRDDHSLKMAGLLKKD